MHIICDHQYQYTYIKEKRGRVGGVSQIAPFDFSNFLKFLDEKYQKLVRYIVLKKQRLLQVGVVINRYLTDLS